MSEASISIEAISDDLVAAYVASGMERGREGKKAIEWAFEDNLTPFAVARLDGRVVGISGYIQNRMKFDRNVGLGVQAVDSFVDESQRGKGIFTRLAQAYDHHAGRSGKDLVWGFPNNNAAPAWFGKLGWHRHGQVPLLIKPLRVGFFCRKLHLPFDFPLTLARDQQLSPITEIGEWADVLWEQTSPAIGLGTVRDRQYLQHRLFAGPQSMHYRVVASVDTVDPALVVTREAEKHGGRISYVMEALGERSLLPILLSELGRLADRGTELALAWSFPWSPNYRALRKAGFIPIPEHMRPVSIWFGSMPKTTTATAASEHRKWYLSYLDSDTA